MTAAVGDMICGGTFEVGHIVDSVDGVDVFEGRDTGGRPRVAWVLRGDASEDVARHFRLRARLFDALDHPLFGTDWSVSVDGDVWVCGPRFDHGATLAEQIAEHGEWGEDRAAELGFALAEGLIEAHALAIVHGNLRPEEVVLTDDGPRVGGFDPLADVRRRPADWADPFVAPEVARGGHAGAEADIYAVGALVRFAATATVVGEVHGLLQPLVDHACAADPADRPTAVEWFASLRDDFAATREMEVVDEPRQIGPYLIDRRLGTGGFASVYLARHTSTNAVVALKVLLSGDKHVTRERRFEREAQLLTKLRAPGTISILDRGIDEGQHYIAFEFVDGETLSAALRRRGRFEPSEVERIYTVLLESLAEAHRAGVLHRDIKPANVMLSRDGDVKLLDFGIARAQGELLEASTNLTATGMILGTPQYISPENLLGDALGPTSDIYSLGLVMYELLVGEAAVQAAGRFELVYRHLDSSVFELPPVAPDGRRWPPQLAEAVNRSLRKNPDARPASAEAVLSILRKRQPGQGHRPRPPERQAAGHRIPTEREAGPASSSVSGQAATFGLDTRLIAALAVLLVAIAVAIAVLVSLRSKPAEPVTEVRPPSSLIRESANATSDAAGEPSGDAAGEADSAGDAEVSIATGCGQQPPGYLFVEMTALRELKSVDYLMFVPRNYDPDRPAPVILLFHDLMMGARDAIEHTEFDRLAEKKGIVLVAPKDHHIPPWWEWEPWIGQQVLSDAMKTMCLDPEKVFAIGLGAGGRSAERLTCDDLGVAAIATSAFRSRADGLCEPGPAVPHLHLAPLNDGYNPVEGGMSKCYAGKKISLARKEELWRTRNGCEGKRRTQFAEGDGECFTWDCDEPFVSCHLEGGRRWDRMTRRLIDRSDCDPSPGEFPRRDTIWSFFEMVMKADAMNASEEADE